MPLKYHHICVHKILKLLFKAITNVISSRDQNKNRHIKKVFAGLLKPLQNLSVKLFREVNYCNGRNRDSTHDDNFHEDESIYLC